MFLRYTVPCKFPGKNHQTALCIEKGESVMICFCNLSFCSYIYLRLKKLYDVKKLRMVT